MLRYDILMAVALFVMLYGYVGKKDAEDAEITYKHIIEIDARKAQLLDSRPPHGCPDLQWVSQGDGETTDWACVSADFRTTAK